MGTDLKIPLIQKALPQSSSLFLVEHNTPNFPTVRPGTLVNLYTEMCTESNQPGFGIKSVGGSGRNMHSFSFTVL